MAIIPIPGFSEPFNSISHITSAVVAFISTFFLIYRGRGNSRRVIGLLIYSFCLVFLLSMSGVYHILEKGFTANYVLKILDYTGIYALIAGTYTPIHLILFRGIYRWSVLLLVWFFSIVGITLTAIFFKDIPEWLSLIFFLSMGWIGLYSMWNIYRVHSKKLVIYLIVGGLAYSLGAIIEFIGWPILITGIIESHEIFHIFVIIGALIHWKLIYEIARYPISSKIKIIVKEFPGNIFYAEATSEHAFFKASSMTEIKELVLQWIDKEFHHDMTPNLVNFKYFKEENIILKKNI